MKIDFHVHSSYSYDGLYSPKEMVEGAIVKGLNAICITDHGETKGVLEAIRFASGKILVIPGIEIKSREGDILGINIREKINDHLPATETIKKVLSLGGLAVIPHPFDLVLSFKKIEKLAQFLKENKTAIEVFNASVSFNYANKKALKFCEDLDLPFIASSDAHSPKFIGKAYTEIVGDNLSPEKIISEIINRNCKIVFEKVSPQEKAEEVLKRGVARIKHYVEKRKI